MFFSAVRDAFKSCSPATLRANVLAGLTVGVVALPLSMALAIASGVPPQHGLYTAIVAGLVIGALGGSRVNISGPTAAFVVILLPITQQYGLGGLLISGLMAGVILLLLGLSGLGRVIEIVPYPVIIGFTAGIGAVIATLQLKDFFGLVVPEMGETYVDKVIALGQAAPSLHLADLSIAVLTLAVMLAWPRLKTRVPAHLVAILVGALITALLATLIDGFDVATIGSRFHYLLPGGETGSGIPPFAPQFEWPWNLPNAAGQPIGLSFGLIHTLLGAAITIALLGAIESLLCAVVADGMSGTKHNPNGELIGQGIGNIVAPFFGGIPATAAIARTATSIRAGATSPVAAMVHGLVILLSVLVLARWLAYIPMASMAALLLVVAWNMSEAKHFVRVIKVAPAADVVVLLTCFGLTVLFDMTVAVGVGLGLAAILFIRRSIEMTGGRLLEDHEHHAHVGTAKHIAIYDINGPLFFGAAQKALKTVSTLRKEVRVVILDMSDVSMIDMTAIVAMESIVKDLKAQGIKLIVNNLHPRMILKLRRAGLRKQRGVIEFARDFKEAARKAG